MSLLTELESAIRTNGLRAGMSWSIRLLVTSFIHPVSTFLNRIFPWIILQGGHLKSVLKENGYVFEYGEPFEVEIELPHEINDVAPPFIQNKIGQRTVSKPFVGTLNDVTLFGVKPIPVWNGKIIQESIVSTPILLLHVGHSAFDYLHHGSRGSQSVETAALIFNHWNSGYFHWTIETLTRLEGIERYVNETGESVKLLVGPELNRYQKETLELLGYSEDDLVRYDATSVTIDTLVIPSNRREFHPGNPAPVDYRWLRERMLESTEEDGEFEIPTRIYISREDAPHRQITNRNQIEDTLSNFGFETVVLTENSVTENIQFFANAEIIVAPHGAGLTDLIYSTDLTVIEFLKEEDCSSAYFMLSQSLGHTYHPIMCEPRGSGMKVKRNQLVNILHEVTDIEISI